MATQGSFNTTAYDSRYLEFAWTRTSYDTVNNSSTISWTLYARGRGQYSQYNAGNFKVIIDGEQVYYSTTRITTTNGLLIASGSKTISHNADGTKSFSASAEAGIYTYAVNCSGSGSWALDAIPRAATLTSAPNFNDEENPTINFVNHLGAGVTSLEACISLTGALADIGFRSIGKSATSLTFTLTDAERAVLRNATLSGSNSRTVIFILRTWIGSNYYDSTATKTFTVINAAPTIAPAVVDMNETTKALTGDLNKFIAGYSTAACSVNATAKKGATITGYQVTNGSQNSNKNVVAFYNVNSGNFTFSVTDNRGNTTSQTLTKTLINYFKPTCKQEAEIMLVEETEAEVGLVIEGDFFNSSFGAVKNTVDIQVRYKIGNGSFTAWQSTDSLGMEIELSGNKYSVTGSITGLPYDEAITVQSRAVDKLATATTANYALRLTPVFDWGKDGFNFNVPVSFNGNQMADYIIEQGTTAMGTNGTWYWTKWHSGKAECYGTRNFGRVSFPDAWNNDGSLFESADGYTQTFPSIFIAAPYSLQMTISYCGGRGALIERGRSMQTASDTGMFLFVSPDGVTLDSSHVCFHAIGRWK